MTNEENTVENVDTTQENNNESGQESNVDTIAVAKADYEKLNQTLGSLKRELKDLRKSKEETKETSKEDSTTKLDSENLLQKTYLRAAQITAEDEVELAITTAKKWGVSVDKLVDDEDFKIKLDKLRTNKANVAATSNIRGGAGTSQAKNTPEYWIAKGVPPTTSDVPDRKVRAKIARAMMDSTKNSKKFYNE